MKTTDDIYARALDAIQRIVDVGQGVVTEAHTVDGLFSQIRAEIETAVKAVGASARTFTQLSLDSKDDIVTDLNKRYPQGWVLAWTEALPGQTAGETKMYDGCVAHGSVSQTLGLAVYLLDSIKHNITRKQS